jgi:hypothetical protein
VWRRVEEDTPEAFEKRRRLVKLLVERITAGRDEYGVTQVRKTYRFGPPSEAGSGEEGRFVSGINNPSGCFAW